MFLYFSSHAEYCPAQYRHHPDLVPLQERRDALRQASSSLATSMRNTLASEIEEFGDAFDVDRAMSRSRSIQRDTVHLKSPLLIIRYVMETVNDLKSILQDARGKVAEEDAERVVLARSEVLGGLVEIRTDPEKRESPTSWDAKDATKRLGDISIRLQRTLQLDTFNEDKATILLERQCHAQEECKALETRLTEELPKLARLHMSTIGSSHRLPINLRPDITEELGRLTFTDFDHNDEEEETPKKTVVVFDEAGCIPSFELLGLSRLGRDIVALLLVGDKHQLPPFEATQGQPFKPSRSAAFQRRGAREPTQGKQQSLLDASALTPDEGKVMLTTQYRVPRDIADMLNTRVYKGAYNTCPKADVPLLGLTVINVPLELNPRKKYVNSNEVMKGLELVDELLLDRQISSILVITPVSFTVWTSWPFMFQLLL